MPRMDEHELKELLTAFSSESRARAVILLILVVFAFISGIGFGQVVFH